MECVCVCVYFEWRADTFYGLEHDGFRRLGRFDIYRSINTFTTHRIEFNAC